MRVRMLTCEDDTVDEMYYGLVDGVVIKSPLVDANGGGLIAD